MMALITIDCKSLLSFLDISKPTIIIDGVKQTNTSWANPNTYEVMPGAHKIQVARSWYLFFPIQHRIARTTINVFPNDDIVIKYSLPIFVFLPGKLTIASSSKFAGTEHVQQQKNHYPSSAPALCPACKNPITLDSNFCQWCGSKTK